MFKIIYAAILLTLSFLGIALKPVLALFAVFYAYLARMMRVFVDFIFYLFVKYCGNVPEIDTWFARRIKGPGISKDLFTTLDSDDI